MIDDATLYEELVTLVHPFYHVAHAATMEAQYMQAMLTARPLSREHWLYAETDQ